MTVGFTKKAVTPAPVHMSSRPGARTLTAFFDLSLSPISFDFVTFVAVAQWECLQRGLERLHIVFVPAPGEGFRDHPDWDTDYDLDHKHWRLFNLCLPVCWAAPSCDRVTVCATRDHARRIQDAFVDQIYPQGYTVAAPLEGWDKGRATRLAYCGNDIQHLSASPQARRFMRTWIDERSGGRPCVALTLREASFFPQRNADFSIWARFAQALEEKGYFPVIIRDVETVFKAVPEAFADIARFPEALSNLELRAAFYQEVHIAMFVANGPAELCFFNRDIPYLYFVTGDWLTARPTAFESQGIGPDRTPPFANQFQHWLWKAHDENVLMEAFERLTAQLKQGRADGSWEKRHAPNSNNLEPLPDVVRRYISQSRWENGLKICQEVLGENISRAVTDDGANEALQKLTPPQLEMAYLLICSVVHWLTEPRQKDLSRGLAVIRYSEEFWSAERGYKVEIAAFYLSVGKIFLAEGYASPERGLFENVAEIGEMCLRLTPHNEPAKSLLCFAQAESEVLAERFDSAIELYVQGIEHTPTASSMLIRLCGLFDTSGRVFEAIDGYIKLVTEHEVDNQLIFQRLIELLASQGRAVEALQYRKMFQMRQVMGAQTQGGKVGP